MTSSSSSLALKATSALFSLDKFVDSADEPGDEAKKRDVLAFKEHCRAYVKKNDARELAAAVLPVVVIQMLISAVVVVVAEAEAVVVAEAEAVVVAAAEAVVAASLRGTI